MLPIRKSNFHYQSFGRASIPRFKDIFRWEIHSSEMLPKLRDWLEALNRATTETADEMLKELVGAVNDELSALRSSKRKCTLNRSCQYFIAKEILSNLPFERGFITEDARNALTDFVVTLESISENPKYSFARILANPVLVQDAMFLEAPRRSFTEIFSNVRESHETSCRINEWISHLDHARVDEFEVMLREVASTIERTLGEIEKGARYYRSNQVACAEQLLSYLPADISWGLIGNVRELLEKFLREAASLDRKISIEVDDMPSRAEKTPPLKKKPSKIDEVWQRLAVGDKQSAKEILSKVIKGWLEYFYKYEYTETQFYAIPSTRQDFYSQMKAFGDFGSAALAEALFSELAEGDVKLIYPLLDYLGTHASDAVMNKFFECVPDEYRGCIATHLLIKQREFVRHRMEPEYWVAKGNLQVRDTEFPLESEDWSRDPGPKDLNDVAKIERARQFYSAIAEFSYTRMLGELSQADRDVIASAPDRFCSSLVAGAFEVDINELICTLNALPDVHQGFLLDQMISTLQQHCRQRIEDFPVPAGRQALHSYESCLYFLNVEHVSFARRQGVWVPNSYFLSWELPPLMDAMHPPEPIPQFNRDGSDTEDEAVPSHITLRSFGARSAQGRAFFARAAERFLNDYRGNENNRLRVAFLIEWCSLVLSPMLIDPPLREVWQQFKLPLKELFDQLQLVDRTKVLP